MLGELMVAFASNPINNAKIAIVILTEIDVILLMIHGYRFMERKK